MNADFATRFQSEWQFLRPLRQNVSFEISTKAENTIRYGETAVRGSRAPEYIEDGLEIQDEKVRIVTCLSFRVGKRLWYMDSVF